MTAFASAFPIRDRLQRLTPRERLFLLVGGLAVALFLAVLLLSDEGEPAVELGSGPAPVSAPAPQPMAPLPVAASAPVPAAPPISLEGLVLKGVLGGGPQGGSALILFPNGRQRLVRTGREAMPGLRVKEVGLAHAVLTGPTGDVRLDIGRATATALAGPEDGIVAGARASSAGRSAVDHKRETMQYRLGLEPRRSNGRIGGFAVKAGAALPALQKAGLRAGDVLVAVNGQALESEEKILDLSQEIAGSYTAEFEFIRNGKRMKTTMPVNERP